MLSTKAKRTLVGGLGAAGYAFCLLQWFFVVILYLDIILPLIKAVIPSTGDISLPSTPLAQTEPSLLVLIFAFVTMTAVIALSVVALAKLPRAVANSGKRITHAPAEFIVPAITTRHHLKASEKRQLSRRIIFGIKLIACSLPAVIPLLVPTNILPRPIVLTVTLGLFVVSCSLFCLQALLSKLVRVPYETSI